MKFIIAAVTSLIISSYAAPQAMIFPDDPKLANVTTSRQQRQFGFPSDHSSTIVHNGHEYVIQPAEKTSFPDSTVQGFPDSTVQGFPDSTVQESQNNRQFSLLPSLKGMQVGLDFRMPFFNIPFADLLSGLIRPGQTALGSGNNLLGLGTNSKALSALAAIAATSMLFFPKVLSAVGFGQNKDLYRDNSQPEDYIKNLNKVLTDFNIDGNSCAQMALCAIGKAQRSQRSNSRTAGTTTHLDVIESLLNLSSVKDTLNKTGWREAKQYGWSDGDCDAYNPLNRCPLNTATWSQLLSNVGKAL